MSRNLFVVGTGTDVGKTFVTALIVKKLTDCGESAAYFKAAMSGNERGGNGILIPGDAEYVKKISKTPQSVSEMCPYVYENAVSPHLASRIEGNPVNFGTVELCWNEVCGKYGFVTAEGSGGILCPLETAAREIWLSDIVCMTKAPCLLVADAGLGTINAVGLTAHYMKSRNIPLAGIILNRFIRGDIMHEDNLKMCERITGLRVLTVVGRGDREIGMSAEELKALYA